MTGRSGGYAHETLRMLVTIAVVAACVAAIFVFGPDPDPRWAVLP